MAECVLYARVSTKEQQNEGYSIPAQIKAIREFCIREGLTPQEEFIEAESAGKAGRTQFMALCAFLSAHPNIKVVVAHKLDRLYRNFRDQITLEEDLGITPRYVLSDIPATPQGELMRDVSLSVSKYYLSNLAEEVRKGMDEKVSQGGWPHRAPLGYLNDQNTRSLVVDEAVAPLIEHAFRRYASRTVSLSDLCDELYEMGLRSRGGNRIRPSALHTILKNPIYKGEIRYKGSLYPGNHTPLIPAALFALAQQAFEPNRNGNKGTKHTFALRDWLFCAECGCKLTAENQKSHVYYRCTHGKGRENCSERRYTREEALMQQVDEIFASIEIGPDIIEKLVAVSREIDEEEAANAGDERKKLERELAAVNRKAGSLLDSFLEGIVPADAYRKKAESLESERKAFEQRLQALSEGVSEKTSQVEALARTAAGARVEFANASTQGKREILGALLLNAQVKDQNIVSYQLKRPFDALKMDAQGALMHSWWAIQDLNL